MLQTDLRTRNMIFSEVLHSEEIYFAHNLGRFSLPIGRSLIRTEHCFVRNEMGMIQLLCQNTKIAFDPQLYCNMPGVKEHVFDLVGEEKSTLNVEKSVWSTTSLVDVLFSA